MMRYKIENFGTFTEQMDQAKGFKKFIRAQTNSHMTSMKDTHKEKIFVNYMSDKRLISRTLKRTTQLKRGKYFYSIFP